MCEYCPWLDLTKTDCIKYHDEEWGVPLFDDQKLFEFITLESAQAGLSWYTVLKNVRVIVRRSTILILLKLLNMMKIKSKNY